MTREFERVGVVGLGTMGAGIVEVFAAAGIPVVGVERTAELCERGRANLQRSTERAVRRGKLDAVARSDLLERVTLSTDLQALAGCQLVAEAIVEQLEPKRELFSELDSVVSSECVLATNTSSLSVTEIAAATAFPDRVLGLHFFNPAPVQAFVEVVRTLRSDPGLVEDVRRLATRLGKNPVVVGDRAGFIANALLFGYLNSAATMYDERHATREDIDAAMRLGCGYPMGPLALLDLVGLDTAAQILASMHAQSRDRRHAPPPALTQRVAAGMLGRKTGRGFYTYESAGSPVVSADAETPPAEQPQPRSITTIGVVGAGALATGIAENVTGGGFEVTQVSDTDLSALAQADLVVEAAAGEPDQTRSLFRSLGAICKPGAILATSTSRLPVIDCAVAAGRAADVLGLHFRASDTPVVEVVSTVSTDPGVAATARALVGSMGKVAVSSADRAGYVVDALLFPYLNDAVRMLEVHYAGADDIDTAMKQGCALPKGPFEVLDEVGVDVALAVQRRLYEELREPGLAPAPLLEHSVTAGHLGRRPDPAS